MGRKPGAKYPKVILLRLTDDIHAELVRMAEKERRTVSSMARNILEDAIANNKPPTRTPKKKP